MPTDLPPSRFLEIDWSGGGGLALLHGSPTSHVAMLARARGIPMVVQLGAIPDAGATALLDGEGATLELDPQRRAGAHLREAAREPSQEPGIGPARSCGGRRPRGAASTSSS